MDKRIESVSKQICEENVHFEPFQEIVWKVSTFFNDAEPKRKESVAKRITEENFHFEPFHENVQKAFTFFNDAEPIAQTQTNVKAEIQHNTYNFQVFLSVGTTHRFP